MGDPLVEGGRRRWGVLHVHHEAEELRVHYRAPIPRETARRVVIDLLAAGRVPPMQATLLGTPLSRPVLQRFWGTVCQDGEAAYLAVFINDRCLLLPLSHDSRHDRTFTSTYDAVQTLPALAHEATTCRA